MSKTYEGRAAVRGVLAMRGTRQLGKTLVLIGGGMAFARANDVIVAYVGCNAQATRLARERWSAVGELDARFHWLWADRGLKKLEARFKEVNPSLILLDDIQHLTSGAEAYANNLAYRLETFVWFTEVTADTVDGLWPGEKRA